MLKELGCDCQAESLVSIQLRLGVFSGLDNGVQDTIQLTRLGHGIKT